MSRLAAFIALPADDRRLLLKALSALAMVRLGLRLLPVRRVRAWATRQAAPGTVSTGRLVWSVGAASRALPGTTCLASAFALQRLLSRQGRASELHIGVARNAQGFAAHAWLTCGGEILVGDEQHEEFAPLVAWPSVERS